MNGVPRSIEECDRELREYRKALKLASRIGKGAAWDQIDRILEIRYLLQTTDQKRRGKVRRSQR